MPTDATAEQQYTNELKHLASFIPKRISIAGMPNMRARQAVVHFPDINLLKYPNCQKALELFCWPTNAKPQRWVQDPVIEGGPDDGKLAGLWRMVRVETDKAKYQGLLVTLREGYASSLQWDEAMLSNADWLQEAEKYADIIFPNIDPEKVQAIVDGIASHTTEPFTVRGHVYAASVASPWEYLRVKPEQQDDGSYAIRLFAARPQYTQVLYENYGTPEQTTKTVCSNVPKRLADSVVTTYNKVYGASGSSNYSTQQGTVDLIFTQRDVNHVTIRNLKTYDGCEYTETSDFWYNYTKSEVEAFDINAASVYGPLTQGYEFSVEGVSYAGAGRYTIKTVKRQVKATNHGTISYESNAEATTIVQVLSGQTSVPTITKGTNFFEWVRAVKDRFCTWSVQKFRRTSIPWSETFNVTTEDGTVEVHTIAGNQPTIVLPTITGAQGLRLSGPTRNDDGSWNWHAAVVPRENGLGTGGTATYRTGYVRSRSIYDADNDAYVNQRQETEFTISVKQFATLAEAYAWANSGAWCRGSPVDKIGRGMFLGFKTGGSVGLWTTED